MIQLPLASCLFTTRRWNGILRGVALVGLALALGGLAGASSARASECPASVTVGLDTSYINSWADVGPLPGYAQGETFLAPYTEILSITLWRPWYDTPEGSVWHMFVMGVDSVGVPNPYNIIQDGPTLWIPNGDGIHPTEFRFVFDPPVHLPSVGLYEFAVQGDACSGNFLVAADARDDYPDGISWRHGREDFCLYRPRAYPEGFPNGDLVFQIEFCEANTPTQPVTWGRIKALYR